MTWARSIRHRWPRVTTPARRRAPNAARDEARRLRSEVITHRANYAAGTAGVTDPADDIADYEPESWQDIADVSKMLQTNGFVLTQRALAQLDGNPYPDHERMWRFLVRLRAAGMQYHKLDGVMSLGLV